MVLLKVVFVLFLFEVCHVLLKFLSASSNLKHPSYAKYTALLLGLLDEFEETYEHKMILVLILKWVSYVAGVYNYNSGLRCRE